MDGKTSIVVQVGPGVEAVIPVTTSSPTDTTAGTSTDSRENITAVHALRSSPRGKKTSVKEEPQTQLVVDTEGNVLSVSTVVEAQEDYDQQDVSQDDVNAALAEAVKVAVSGMVVDDMPQVAEEPRELKMEMLFEEDSWAQNNCIICNADLEPADGKPGELEAKLKLKKFFCEYLGIQDPTNPEEDNFVPFCGTCGGEIEKLVSLSSKIEFMDMQFDKLRDTLARRAVKTYLYRNKPELLDDDAEKVQDVESDPLEMKERTKFLSPPDLFFTQWKRQYDMVLPGRFKKYPVLMRASDNRHRMSYYRLDSSGKHHFILGLGPEPEIQPVRITPGVTKRSRARSTTGDTPKAKRQRENSTVGTDNSDPAVEQVDVLVATPDNPFPFECAECPRTYSTKSLLKCHARIHTGEKPYKCHQCPKTFGQRGGLATHLLVHSGEKPFVCEECGKHFRQKYHLTQHKLIHSGIKPFKCDLCDKCFNVKMNLKEHMRRHTGERPYNCDYCENIGFFRKKKLRDHLVKFHPDIPLPGDLESLGPSNDIKDNESSVSDTENNKIEEDEGDSSEEDVLPDKPVKRSSSRSVKAT